MLDRVRDAFCRDRLRGLSLAYIALPNLIFVLGWLWWPYALIFGGLLSIGLLLAMAAGPAVTRSAPDRRLLRYGLLALAVVAWLSLSGIGGFHSGATGGTGMRFCAP